MIVDVGAGTTDFCILCLKKRADGDLEPIQIRHGALSVETAGNSVDSALVEFLVREQAGEEHRARLTADAPRIKERLFALTAADDERFDYDELPGQMLLDVGRQDFLASTQWREFENALREAQARCFDGADRKYLQDFGQGAIRVIMTGGGSALPLQLALAEGVSPGEVKVERIAAADFPLAVRQRFADNLADLPRLAVALGGCRDALPADYDRSHARTTTGITPAYVWSATDKSSTGVDDAARAPVAGAAAGSP